MPAHARCALPMVPTKCTAMPSPSGSSASTRPQRTTATCRSPASDRAGLLRTKPAATPAVFLSCRHLLLKKQRRAEGRIELIAREALALVGPQRASIARQHLEREFAGTPRARLRLHLREHALHDAPAPMARQHDHVVHVDERPAGEGGEALHAVDEPDGLA